MANNNVQRDDLLKALPAVHEILDWPRLRTMPAGESIPRWALRRAVQNVLEAQRREILQGDRASIMSAGQMEENILAEAKKQLQCSLRPVINATGVLLHTNLGRAPLAKEALDSLLAVAKGYSNLEFNLDSGRRGRRYSHVEDLLCEITGAEAALVVNNNAAAVYLALRVLAQGKEVIVSRGELVEIGGSFRIPDILTESGAKLVEVGTTNRVHLKDYEGAIGPATGLLLKVHPSNYRIIGFHKEIPLADLVSLGHRENVPVIQDLGSGSIVDPVQLGLQGEPSVQETLASGADMVTFSGDKLLGGPQAGILLGKAELMQQVQAHPLNRVLRIDKLTLAALEATLLLYRDFFEAARKVPVLTMLTLKEETLRKRAQRLAQRLKQVLPADFRIHLCATLSKAGGGAMPEASVPGTAVAVKSSNRSCEALLSQLRQATPPVIARIEKDEVILDVRTLQKGDDLGIEKAFRGI